MKKSRATKKTQQRTKISELKNRFSELPSAALQARMASASLLKEAQIAIREVLDDRGEWNSGKNELINAIKHSI